MLESTHWNAWALSYLIWIHLTPENDFRTFGYVSKTYPKDSQVSLQIWKRNLKGNRWVSPYLFFFSVIIFPWSSEFSMIFIVSTTPHFQKNSYLWNKWNKKIVILCSCPYKLYRSKLLWLFLSAYMYASLHSNY